MKIFKTIFFVIVSAVLFFNSCDRIDILGVARNIQADSITISAENLTPVVLYNKCIPLNLEYKSSDGTPKTVTDQDLVVDIGTSAKTTFYSDSPCTPGNETGSTVIPVGSSTNTGVYFRTKESISIFIETGTSVGVHGEDIYNIPVDAEYADIDYEYMVGNNPRITASGYQLTDAPVPLTDEVGINSVIIIKTSEPDSYTAVIINAYTPGGNLTLKYKTFQSGALVYENTIGMTITPLAIVDFDDIDGTNHTCLQSATADPIYTTLGDFTYEGANIFNKWLASVFLFKVR